MHTISGIHRFSEASNLQVITSSVILGKPDIHMQKNEVGLLPYIKINSKQITNLNVRPDTTKFLKENTGEKLHNIGFGNDFST